MYPLLKDFLVKINMRQQMAYGELSFLILVTVSSTSRVLIDTVRDIIHP